MMHDHRPFEDADPPRTAADDRLRLVFWLAALPLIAAPWIIAAWLVLTN